MGGNRTVTAAEGRVRYAYHTAAVLRGCTVARTDGAWSLVGSVVTVDAFRVTCRPLTFVVRHATGAWTWPILDLQVNTDVFTATLGPPER